MSLNVDVDPTLTSGYPGLAEAKRHNTQIVRMISRPQAEALAGAYMAQGIEVIGIITGQSYPEGADWRTSDPYVMPSCSMLQLGNESMMGHAASFPSGNAATFIQFWERVRHYVRVTLGRSDLPLVGPGIWMQRPELWASIRNECNEIVVGAIHVYEGAGDTFADLAWVERNLNGYMDVARDLNYMVTEYTAWWPHTIKVLRVIRKVGIEVAIWAHYGHGVPGHGLVGTTEYQLVSTFRP